MGFAVILICATAIYITHTILNRKYPKNKEQKQSTDEMKNGEA